MPRPFAQSDVSEAGVDLRDEAQPASYLFSASVRDNLLLGLRHCPEQTSDYDAATVARWEREIEEARPRLEDPRVLVAVEEYLTAQQAGRRPERQAFLAEHPNEIEYLRVLLGHKDYQMILKHYGHLVDQTEQITKRLKNFDPFGSSNMMAEK